MLPAPPNCKKTGHRKTLFEVAHNLRVAVQDAVYKASGKQTMAFPIEHRLNGNAELRYAKPYTSMRPQ